MTTTFHELIAHRAAASPDATALAAPGSGGLTYGRLRDLTAATGKRLAELGVKRGDRVAIVAGDGPELAAAFLAIGSYVTAAPLNPAYKRPELEFFLEDLEPALLVAAPGSLAVAVAEDRNIPVAFLEPKNEPGWFDLTSAAAEAAEEITPAGTGDVALVLHTSGTTARPKIVPLTHANLLASADNIGRTLLLGGSDRCLNVMPLFHIHGLIGVLLSTIRSGGTVVCTPGFSADLFIGWLRADAPTWYSAVPTMHQSALNRLAEAGAGVLDGVPLRFVRSSSAPLPPVVIAGLEAKLGVPVIEAYGMTEASHQITSNPLPPGIRRPGSVGQASGERVKIACQDEPGRGTGHVGEVLIRGDNVTRGYENNPAANDETFADGWFRTGDLGYLDEEGYLHLTGRIKEIINRGGEKVSPREVDDVLAEHPALRQVVTFAVPHDTLGEDIAVAVVLHPGEAVDEKSIREFAFDRLAGYKVPSHVVVVEEIPRGPTGKLQRIGLFEKLASKLRAPFEAPAPGVEESLARIWEEVLGKQRVGAGDNFFMLGGDSITATMVVARIGERMGIEVPLPLIFREPTLRLQAESILHLQVDALPPGVLEKYLAELSGMSDEEAERALGERGRPE